MEFSNFGRGSVQVCALFMVGAYCTGQADPGLFAGTVIDEAKTLISELPGYVASSMDPANASFEQSADAVGEFATYNHNTNTITIYPKTFLADPAFDCLKLDGLSGKVAVGVVVGAIFHELIHKCYGSAGGAMQNDCWNEYRSCPHLQIDFAVHAALCAMVDDVVAENCPDDPDTPENESEDCDDDIHELLVGICEELKRLEDKWNNADGQAVLEACLLAPPCALPTSSSCPTGNSIRCGRDPSCQIPDPSPYPPDDGGQVLETCEGCGPFTN